MEQSMVAGGALMVVVVVVEVAEVVLTAFEDIDIYLGRQKSKQIKTKTMDESERTWKGKIRYQKM
jgi:hypothetical protein